MVLLFVFISIFSAGFSNSYPTEEQVNKLVSSVWKEPPNSIDVTLYIDATVPKESEEQLRQKYEQLYNLAEGPREKLSPYKIEMRNKNIQINVEKDLREQKVGRKIKQRIRIDGCRQRIDETFGRTKTVFSKETGREKILPEVILDSNTPYETTRVNLGDKEKGDYTSFQYSHNLKSAMITNNRGSMWAKSDIMYLSGLPEWDRLIMRMMSLGKKQETASGMTFIPDEEKLKKISNSGELDSARISIEPDTNEPDTRDKIIISYPSESNGIRTTIVCDRKDYSRIFLLDKSNPETGKVFYRRECDNFDHQGFPHNITIMELDKKGNLTKKVYRIEKVDVNPVIPDEVFQFNPPEDYEIVKVDPNDMVRIIREMGGFEGDVRKLDKAAQAKDVQTLKSMLKNESPIIRLDSLRVLKRLLAKDKDGLKEAVSILENDDDPKVRQEAEKILRSLKGTE